MKFSKPEDMDTVESAESDPQTPAEMPLVESGASEKFDFEAKPIDKMVATNGDLIVTNWERVTELEDRLDELEKQNERLTESLRKAYQILDKVDSVSQFSLNEPVYDPTEEFE